MGGPLPTGVSAREVVDKATTVSYQCARIDGSVTNIEEDQTRSGVPYKDDDRQFNSGSLPKQIRVEIEVHQSCDNSDYKTVPKKSVASVSIHIQGLRNVIADSLSRTTAHGME